MPVIVLSARQDEFDKVAALRLGADDYVTKPFALAELLARVAAVLRRSRQSAAPPPPAAAPASGRAGARSLRRRRDRSFGADRYQRRRVDFTHLGIRNRVCQDDRRGAGGDMYVSVRN